MSVNPSSESRSGGGPKSPQHALRIAAIIYGALMAGLVAFAGVVVFLVTNQEPGVEETEEFSTVLPIVATVLTVTMVLPTVTLGGTLLRASAGARGLGPAERAQRFVGMKVMFAALAEGPGLFWGVLALISGNLVHLCGLAFSVFALALLFPKEQEWIDATGSSRMSDEFEEPPGG